MKPRTPRSHAHDFLYRKIAEDLRAKLRTGAIAPGARLPPAAAGYCRVPARRQRVRRFSTTSMTA